MLREGTLKTRALRVVGSRSAVSTQELEQFGVSRQVTSIMFKRGLLKRIRFGVYSAAPEVLAKLGAIQ